MSIIKHEFEKIGNIYFDILTLGENSIKDSPPVLEGYLIHFGMQNDYANVMKKIFPIVPSFNSYQENGTYEDLSIKIQQVKNFFFRHRDDIAQNIDQFTSLLTFIIMDNNGQATLHMASMDYNHIHLLNKIKEEEDVMALHSELQQELSSKISNSKMKV